MSTQSSPPDDTPSSLAETLVPKVLAYVKHYMSGNDSSHDFAHILRVLGLAHTLRSQNPSLYDHLTTTLAALLHDVGDRKYVQPTDDSATMVHEALVSLGAPAPLAEKIQTIVSAVSYSSERKDGGAETVRSVMERFPELAIVQDADRLDAIGAVGVARAFAYWGATGKGELRNAVDHFEEKLVRLEGMMKTEMGREMARVRTERVRGFKEMYEEEVGEAAGGLGEVDGVDLRDL